MTEQAFGAVEHISQAFTETMVPASRSPAASFCAAAN
jgi:hypothetical protein